MMQACEAMNAPAWAFPKLPETMKELRSELLDGVAGGSQAFIGDGPGSDGAMAIDGVTAAQIFAYTAAGVAALITALRGK